MKKIDKLVLISFLKLFALTVCVAFFVLLVHFFLVHFDELLGKSLGLTIYAQLASYVAIMAVKQAFPLAILLSSIMALGGLGEHHELTALKSAGVALPRILLSPFLFVLLLSVLVYFSNSYVAPRAHFDAFSLLHDLIKKKPSIAIKEGIFYDGIPGYSIKARKKMSDKKTLQGIMLYDHTQNRGNISLTVAKSGKIYTIHDETYLVIELFDGHNYVEILPHADTDENYGDQAPQFYRSSFKAQKLLVSLESLQLSRTKKELFTRSYSTKNTQQLAADIVVMRETIKKIKKSLSITVSFLPIEPGDVTLNTTVPEDLLEAVNILNFKAYIEQQHHIKSKELYVNPDLLTALSIPYKATDLPLIYEAALDQVRAFQEKLATQVAEIKRLEKEIKRHELARNKMLAWAVSCIIVFLIGAPLGAIVKKGGLGVPLIIATGLIIWHYFFEMLGEKWVQKEVIDPFSGAWLANSLLLLFGLFFFKQGYRDMRLLEADFYAILLGKVKEFARKLRKSNRDAQDKLMKRT